MNKLKTIYEVTITLEYQETEFDNLCADLQEIHKLYKDNILSFDIQKEQILDHDTPKEKEKALLI